MSKRLMQLKAMLKRAPRTIGAAGKILAEEASSFLFSKHKWGDNNCTSRVLFVSYALNPTLQLSFIKPLSPLFKSSQMAAELLTEQQILARFGGHRWHKRIVSWIDRRILKAAPSVIVFCRYSGRYAEHIVKLAHKRNIRTIFHIDDDLLNVPMEIGKAKHEYHNHPKRLASVRYLLSNVDLVYCSTEALKQRLQVYSDSSRFIAGGIYCASTIVRQPEQRPTQKIGYMGFDHNHDFELVVPALTLLMREFPHLTFELFGSISKPTALNEFGDRIQVLPPVRNYEKFLQTLAERQWDIGICPLADTHFNKLKANTKWIEYTAVGAAVVASRNTIYDECCSEGCGLLAEGTDGWVTDLRNLITQDSLRYNLVNRAQERLQNNYSIGNLTQQVVNILALVDISTANQQAPEAIN